MKKICFISGSSPEFLGGISLYQRNLIEFSKNNKEQLNFTWIYPGRKNRNYSFKGINCLEVKSSTIPILKEFDFSKKTKKILKNHYFDFINTHANWGYCLRNYRKRESQKIIHTYHGVTVPYMKIQLKRFNFIKRILLNPLIWGSYLLEKAPMKKADQIICVSEKVKDDLERIYWKRGKMTTIRTGVDINQFKGTSKKKARETLDLDDEKIYGLYSGRGGYWNKGLDRAISISEEIYRVNKNYRLIVIGADENKCEKYLKKEFIEYRGLIDRKNLSKYYSASDFFFFLSRYEGGAPALAVGEAMASECLIIFSKDSKQEIIENEKEGLVFEKFDKESSEKILLLLKNWGKIGKIKENAKKKIKNLDISLWGKKYLTILLK